jgi:saccharopine dehydrogenase-like NADP-dependent oxidoreductase
MALGLPSANRSQSGGDLLLSQEEQPATRDIWATLAVNNFSKVWQCLVDLGTQKRSAVGRQGQ